MIRAGSVTVPTKRRTFFRRGMDFPQIRASGDPGKQKGHPATWAAFFFQGRIVPTEAKSRQNFPGKEYEPKNRSVKQFLGNKCLCFQSFTQSINIEGKCINLRRIALITVVSRYF